MIRVNSTSTLKLVPTTEIRYKACGESPASCQEIFTNIESEKTKFIAQARAKYQEELSRKREAAQLEWYNARRNSIDCQTSRRAYRRASINAMPVIDRDDLSSRQCQTTYSQMIRAEAPVMNASSFSLSGNEPSFTPTEEDTKKIIKELSSNSLNEYTFSKADGSIVVICPTRYCAIASGDGGWIGIGERGKSIEIKSVVK
jgi:hypothetical protein